MRPLYILILLWGCLPCLLTAQPAAKPATPPAAKVKPAEAASADTTKTATLPQPDADAEGDDAPTLTPLERLNLEQDINSYLSDMQSMTTMIGFAQTGQLKTIQRLITSLSNNWDNWYKDQQALIALDDSLSQMVVEFQEAQTMANDSLVSRQNILDAITQFHRAEKTVKDAMAEYKKMEKEAERLSMLEQLASQLEKLKGREQVRLAEVQASYDQAKQATAVNPTLQKSMAKLEDIFIDIKISSDHIQQAAFKPLFERIKDYLMGLAAVSIILMFVSFLMMRLQSAIKAKKAAEEMKKLMDQQNQDYPTI